MPTPMDAMLGLVVIALGLLSFVVSFLVTDQKKQMIAYGLAGFVTLVGLYYYVGSELRGFQMRRRIANIQRQQQVNLEEIQKRLKDQQVQQGKAPEVPPVRR